MVSVVRRTRSPSGDGLDPHAQVVVAREPGRSDGRSGTRRGRASRRRSRTMTPGDVPARNCGAGPRCRRCTIRSRCGGCRQACRRHRPVGGERLEDEDPSDVGQADVGEGGPGERSRSGRRWRRRPGRSPPGPRPAPRSAPSAGLPTPSRTRWPRRRTGPAEAGRRRTRPGPPPLHPAGRPHVRVLGSMRRTVSDAEHQARAQHTGEVAVRRLRRRRRCSRAARWPR